MCNLNISIHLFISLGFKILYLGKKNIKQTAAGYKHNDKTHFTFKMTFRILRSRIFWCCILLSRKQKQQHEKANI